MTSSCPKEVLPISAVTESLPSQRHFQSSKLRDQGITVVKLTLDTLMARVHPALPVSLLWIDIGLITSAIALLLEGFSSLRFEVTFALVLVTAMRLNFRQFMIRATATGFVASLTMSASVIMGNTPVGELWEIPGHGATILVAFAYAAERDRASRSVETARARLMSTVSHDIRNPLSAALGMAQLLSDSDDVQGADDVVAFAGTITEAVQEALYMVEDLSTASRLEAGNLHIIIDEVELPPVLHSLASGMTSEKSSIIVETRGEPMICLADEMRLRQILRNLITNARRYGGPTVSLRAVVDGPTVRIQVTDDGPGVPLIDSERIFEPFSQVQGVSRPAESMGLGLSSARQLARQMGGDLRYGRESGETVFELTLPGPGTRSLGAALPLHHLADRP